MIRNRRRRRRCLSKHRRYWRWRRVSWEVGKCTSLLYWSCSWNSRKPEHFQSWRISISYHTNFSKLKNYFKINLKSTKSTWDQMKTNRNRQKSTARRSKSNLPKSKLKSTWNRSSSSFLEHYQPIEISITVKHFPSSLKLLLYAKIIWQMRLSSILKCSKWSKPSCYQRLEKLNRRSSICRPISLYSIRSITRSFKGILLMKKMAKIKPMGPCCF